MSLDPDRLADLRRAKLRALVRSATGGDVEVAETRSIPDGAVLTGRGLHPGSPDATATWVLVEGPGSVRALGGALAVAMRTGSGSLDLVVDDRVAAGILARRAAALGFDITVHVAGDGRTAPAEPAVPAVDSEPAAEIMERRRVLSDAGLRPVVEGGHLIGELLGLEVARVVGLDGHVAVEAGVGRFDREAGAMIRAGMDDAASLQAVIDIVAPLRRSGAELHPVNRLVRERWMREAAVRDPALVGAALLAPVGSAVPRADLREEGVATAIGTDLSGDPVIVTFAGGTFLDTVPSAVDDRLTHAPGSKLVIAVPAGAAAPVLADMVAFADRASLLEVPEGWEDR